MIQKKKNIRTTGQVGKIKRLECEVRGAKADAKGLRYEQAVADYFASRYWKIVGRRKQKYGYEYDILGERGDILTGPEYLVVECKCQGRISARDVVRFIKKVDVYYKHFPERLLAKPPIHAYLCYSGEVDRDAADVAKAHRPSIKFMKL